jgi:hypothetical protein
MKEEWQYSQRNSHSPFQHTYMHHHESMGGDVFRQPIQNPYAAHQRQFTTRPDIAALPVQRSIPNATMAPIEQHLNVLMAAAGATVIAVLTMNAVSAAH